MKRARQRVNFNDPAVDYSKEIGELARRAIDGDLCRASIDARWLAVSYAARSAASTKNGIETARKLMAAADQIAPGRSHIAIEAAIAMHDGADAALKILRDVKTPEARSQIAIARKVSKGAECTVAWVIAEGLTPVDFTSVGAHNITVMAIEANDLAFARSWVSAFTVAKTFPADEQPSVIGALPFDLRHVHPAEVARSIEVRRKATADLAKVLTVARGFRQTTLYGSRKWVHGSMSLLILKEKIGGGSVSQATLKFNALSCCHPPPSNPPFWLGYEKSNGSGVHVGLLMRTTSQQAVVGLRARAKRVAASIMVFLAAFAPRRQVADRAKIHPRRPLRPPRCPSVF